MPKGWLYNWVGIARRKQNLETCLVESLLVIYLCTLKLSLTDAQKTTPAPSGPSDQLASPHYVSLSPHAANLVMKKAGVIQLLLRLVQDFGPNPVKIWA